MENYPDIVKLLACYGSAFLLFVWVSAKGSGSLSSVIAQNGRWVPLHIRHAGGILSLAAMPMLLSFRVPAGLLSRPPMNGLQLLLVLISAALLVNIALKNSRWIMPATGIHNSRSFHFALYIVLRLLFLASYEWFFRGLLLYSCWYSLGLLPAIAINLGLYALIHCINGKKEIIGSLPFGLLLCIITVWCQSIWPAVFLHLVLSFSYELPLLFPYLKKSKIAL